jgi:hypothetical protein
MWTSRWLMGLVGGALAAGVAAHAEADVLYFADDFEGSTLDPFWTTSEVSGQVVFPSSTHAHSGTQCLELVSADTGLEKRVGVFHRFDEPVPAAQFTVWVYDTGADSSSSNTVTMYLWNYGLDHYVGLRALDFNFGEGGNYQIILARPEELKIDTGVPRTEAWHKFEVTSLAGSLEFSVDNQHVYTASPMLVEGIALAMHAPEGPPAWESCFDDVELGAIFVPEPSALAALIGLFGTGLLGSWLRRRRTS